MIFRLYFVIKLGTFLIFNILYAFSNIWIDTNLINY